MRNVSRTRPRTGRRAVIGGCSATAILRLRRMRPAEFDQAAATLRQADDLAASGGRYNDVHQLAVLANQRAATAQNVARLRSEQAALVAQRTATDARIQADVTQRQAAVAQLQAAEAQRQAEQAQRLRPPPGCLRLPAPRERAGVRSARDLGARSRGTAAAALLGGASGRGHRLIGYQCPGRGGGRRGRRHPWPSDRKWPRARSCDRYRRSRRRRSGSERGT